MRADLHKKVTTKTNYPTKRAKKMMFNRMSMKLLILTFQHKKICCWRTPKLDHDHGHLPDGTSSFSQTHFTQKGSKIHADMCR